MVTGTSSVICGHLCPISGHGVHDFLMRSVLVIPGFHVCFPGDCVKCSISSNKFIFWSNYSVFILFSITKTYTNLIGWSHFPLFRCWSFVHVFLSCLKCTFYHIYLLKFHFPTKISHFLQKCAYPFHPVPSDFLYPWKKNVNIWYLTTYWSL